jgi:hypothetical protein
MSISASREGRSCPILIGGSKALVSCTGIFELKLRPTFVILNSAA